MSRPRTDGRVLSVDRTEILEQLRRHAVAFDDNLRRLGAWMGVSPTDAMALADVIWAETSHQPMTPARLARRTGMSSGSTTALIDRLERGGHLVRSRESADRRVVTLRENRRKENREHFHSNGNASSDICLLVNMMAAKLLRRGMYFRGTLGGKSSS